MDNLKLILDIEAKLTPQHAGKVRGYLGSLFWENPYAHQHNADGSLIYRYPCVQYKVIKGACVLIGFNEGVEIVKKTFHDLIGINLSGTWEEVLSKSLESYSAPFNVCAEQRHYSFLTPWLALNEKNYDQYKKLKSWLEKKALLEKVLIGNIISMSKSLGYTVPEPIKANIGKMKEIPTTLKGTPMLGFLGDFSVNFEIPDYWGIGKSVSRGFGTVKRQITEHRCQMTDKDNRMLMTENRRQRTDGRQRQ